MTTAPDRPILDRISQYLLDEDWPFERDDEEGILHAIYRGERIEFDCYVQAIEEDAHLLFFSLAPFLVPPERLAATAEMIARINFGLPIGGYELNFDGGELRYKTSLESSAEALTGQHLEALVEANLAVMERYLLGLRAVVFGEADPAAIVAEIEG